MPGTKIKIHIEPTVNKNNWVSVYICSDCGCCREANTWFGQIYSNPCNNCGAMDEPRYGNKKLIEAVGKWRIKSKKVLWWNFWTNLSSEGYWELIK